MDRSAEERLHASIRQTLAGNRDAFGELYDLTIHEVKKTVLFLLDNKQDAEDVIHDIYLEVYRSLHNYDHARTFSSWLTGVAVRQIQNYRRRGWKIVRLFNKVQLLSPVQTVPDISKEVVEQLEQQQLMEQIQQLPFKFRSVLVLKYWHGCTQEEIAEILQLPIGTVKSRLHHALMKAREIVSQQSLTLGREQ
ncbi:RNA polymerase sigma factor [Brevibacillus panacihumi W25]|uniref:RNA polymerase sigma factor n=2 Tax=Brevibacillus panacihumi TaxID=497735 RepID=V6M4F4_9BACL|nr:sigma-70 family RNA polymerase sigma factor [Brevibacillus panacihumi]EST53464.1 RNA polymerase sigma factor [Brevibacillus panacihumi W25]RNB77641.1 sigma-70 family RNA polymerase sigma factor [Brevibacillus panacihumi]